MCLHFRGPLQERIFDAVACGLRHFRRRHFMDEGLRRPDVEDASLDSVLSKYKEWKSRGRQDAGLQLIPWRRHPYRLSGLHGFLGVALNHPGRRPELLKPKDDATRTVPDHSQHLAEGQIVRVLIPSEGPPLESVRLKLVVDDLCGPLLRRAEIARAGNEYRDLNAGQVHDAPSSNAGT